MIIDILDWDITYTDLMQWVAETGAELYAITHAGWLAGGTPGTKYVFRDEEDFVMFKLKFAKENGPHKMNYTGRTTIMNAAYHCPHIPTLNEKSNN